MPDVSVVIPTYNRRGYVCEAVDSVLGQSLHDVEIVVVDDGSTDGTGPLLAERYGGRICYLYQKNQGRSAARNRGAELAMGRYVTFLDSDDLLLPGALETLSTALDRDASAGVAYADGYYCDKDGQVIEPFSLGTPTPSGDVLDTLMVATIVVIPAAAMVRRTWLERLGWPLFDASLRGTEDRDFWLRLAALGCSFRYVDEVVCKYRLHGSNESDPHSPNRERRRASLRRGLLKMLDADYFSHASVRTRERVLWRMLLSVWGDDLRMQGEILRHPHFVELPVETRASLLYYVGVHNVVESGAVTTGWRRLASAVELEPGRPKYRLALLLARYSPPLLRMAVTWRRRIGRRLARQGVDHGVAPHWRSEPPGYDPGR